MAAKNDEKILELKKQIENKRKALSEVPNFQPITNCILTELDEGKTYNINVLGEDALRRILIRMNMYRISADDLGLDVPTFDGYTIED